MPQQATPTGAEQSDGACCPCKGDSRGLNMALTRTDTSMGAQLSHGQLGKHTVHAPDGAQVAAPQPSLKEK